MDKQDSYFSISDEDFMAKASTFLMTQQLTKDRFVDFPKLVRVLDKKIAKDFMNAIVQKICVKNGQIIEILFKNGILLKFSYEE